MNYQNNNRKVWTVQMNSDLVALKEAGVNKTTLSQILGRKPSSIELQYDKILKGHAESSERMISPTARLIAKLLNSSRYHRGRYNKAMEAIEAMIESGFSRVKIEQ